MTIEKRGAYTAAETAFILRQMLGPDRERWNYLNDIRQDRVGETFPRLTPVGYVRVRGSKQPVYRPRDISSFAKTWRARFPDAGGRPRPVPIYFLDDSDDRRHWRYRDLTVVKP